MNHSFTNSDAPMEIGTALAANLKAVYALTELTDAQRNAFLSGANNITSTQEMQEYVNSLLRKN